MRKLTSIAFGLSLLALSHAALAQGATDYGTPISSAVIVTFPDGGTVFKPKLEDAAFLADAKDAALVTIRGRTSTNTPSAKDESLALARALSARSYLVASGVSPLKIAVNFASAADFIANNSTPEGRRENQRVEVEIIYVTPSVVQ